MGTTQKSVFAGNTFFQGIKALFMAKAAVKSKEEKKTEKTVEHGGYHRSTHYIAPADFYRHGSGLFSGNRRAEIKRGKRLRAA